MSARLNRNRYVCTEEQEEPQQSLNRKSGDTAADQCGNLRLIDAQDFCGLNLRQATRVADSSRAGGFAVGSGSPACIFKYLLSIHS